MPTTNPVPSTDPTDLLFNAGKLDEVVNGTANSFTDRLGVARRTVAGMNADFDAQLADAESDLNVYRADAAASAAEALGYLQTIRATSYGAYASDPATDPLGNPPTVGDEYFNTTSNLLKRWNGATWQASDINTANLAASSGSSLVGYDGGTVQDVLDGAKYLQDYITLRAYTGRAKRIYITGLLGTAKPAGIAGVFQYDPTDTTSADNGGTIIVGADGRRWKRDFSGSISPEWFGAVGDEAADDTLALRKWIAAPGGTHELTDGKVYLVGPTEVGGVIIPIASGSKRVVNGNGGTIKVKNASGAFSAIFGSLNSADDLSGVKIGGVIFDHNRAGNTYTIASNLLNYGHNTFAARKGSDIVFTGNVVKNAVSTNCVYINGDNGTGVNQCKRPVVSENTFISIGGGTSIDYDHSTIYTHADYDSVYGNKGWTESFNAYGTAAFVETHGTATKVYENFCYGFKGLANITGVRGEGDSEYLQVYGNGGEVVEHGIRMFSAQLSPHSTGYGINGCDVFGNQIRIRQTLLAAGPNFYIGVGFQPGASLPAKDIRIFNNHVIYDEETAASTYNVAAPAFGVMETSGTTLFENIEIFGNTSKNAPACGVSLGMGGGQFKNCVIGRNTHVNPGAGLNAAVSGYKSAVILWGNSYTGSLTIEKQTIIDNFATTRLVYGVYSAPAVDGSAIPCTIELDIKLNGANKSAFAHAMNNSDSKLRPLLKAFVNAPLALASQTFKGGTEIFDSANEETYRILVTGSIFTRHSYGTAAPSGTLYQVGSTVTNTAPTAGGAYKWVCVGAGLPGTWKPVSIAA